MAAKGGHIEIIKLFLQDTRFSGINEKETVCDLIITCKQELVLHLHLHLRLQKSIQVGQHYT